MSSIRYDGIYGSNSGTLYFRLHADGIAQAFRTKPDTSPETAASIVWPGLGRYGKGTYQLAADDFEMRVSFQADSELVFRGKLVAEGLELCLFRDGQEHPAKLFRFHALSPVQLTPPLLTRAHAVRERLATSELEYDRVEAAAALGDPVARVSLRPAFDIDAIAEFFAKLGGAACVRLLLALSWSDDGRFFYPRQGLTTGGGHRGDEGKVMRSLAKWCIKPDPKVLAKAGEQMAEVVKVGPAFVFLDLMMRAAQATSDADRAAALRKALKLHIVEDPYIAFETTQTRIVPWLLGDGDWLAEHMKQIK